jgi:multidrug efflux pump subunit AcrA (membrane-fusion protein)
MTKNKPLLVAAGALALLLLTWWALSGEDEQNRDITAKAFKAPFKDVVTSSGELMAKNSEDIKGPRNLRRFGLYNIKISKLIPEGTYVKAGDFVASLDKSELSSKIQDAATELEKARSQYTQTRLDTSLTLREKRSAIESIAFDLKQKKVELAQSKYEPPATIQRVKLDIEKLEQNLTQTRDNYQIKKKQSEAKMIEAGATLAQEQKRYKALLELEKEFKILAPKQGMVIYKRSWNGRKRQTGSTISPWDPGVAELPDLSLMESRTYINEVDIRKIKKGQKVLIGLDAFPEARLNGAITSVANVGEEREDSDSKVFEVLIEVSESDSTYRPGMTTSNEIIIKTIPEALQIPLEAVFTQNDTTFVYTSGGVSTQKKQVQLGQSNDEFVIVKDGLELNDVVYLNEPSGAKETELIALAKAKTAVK